MRFTKDILINLFFFYFSRCLFSLQIVTNSSLFMNYGPSSNNSFGSAYLFKSLHEHVVWFGFDSISICKRRAFIVIEQQSKVLLKFGFCIGIIEAVFYFPLLFCCLVVKFVYGCCRLVPLCFRHKLSHSTVLINRFGIRTGLLNANNSFIIMNRWLCLTRRFVRLWLIELESAPH